MSTRKVLILYAHPRPDRYGNNAFLAEAVRDLPGVTFVDLYAAYPRFEIDVAHEQAQLLAHDAIIFQFPLYWYSTPALLKEWQDLVLEYGFAYGSSGTALKDKLFASVITTGGPQRAYCRDGYQHFSLRELLQPLEQTANLCHMVFLPPLVLYAAGHAEEENRLQPHAGYYRAMLEALRDGTYDLDAAQKTETLYGENLKGLIREAH